MTDPYSYRAWRFNQTLPQAEWITRITEATKVVKNVSIKAQGCELGSRQTSLLVKIAG